MSVRLQICRREQPSGHKRERALPRRQAAGQPGERGFTIIEVAIAMVVFMVVCLAVASLFSYAAYYTSGGNDRAQALAIAQRTLESMRNYRFSTTVTDGPLLATSTGLNPFSNPTLVAGGSDPLNPTTTGRNYLVQVIVTDVPPIPPLTVSTLKNIRINVTPQGAGMRWATNGGTVTIDTQRAMTGEF